MLKPYAAAIGVKMAKLAVQLNDEQINSLLEIAGAIASADSEERQKIMEACSLCASMED